MTTTSLAAATTPRKWAETHVATDHNIPNDGGCYRCKAMPFLRGVTLHSGWNKPLPMWPEWTLIDVAPRPRLEPGTCGFVDELNPSATPQRAHHWAPAPVRQFLFDALAEPLHPRARLLYRLHVLFKGKPLRRLKQPQLRKPAPMRCGPGRFARITRFCAHLATSASPFGRLLQPVDCRNQSLKHFAARRRCCSPGTHLLQCPVD
jgi:hypothetical protein